MPVSVRMMNEFTERMENESDFPEYMEDEEIQDAYRSIKFVSAERLIPGLLWIRCIKRRQSRTGPGKTQMR